jgi:hypothetical protein
MGIVETLNEIDAIISQAEFEDRQTQRRSDARARLVAALQRIDEMIETAKTCPLEHPIPDTVTKRDEPKYDYSSPTFKPVVALDFDGVLHAYGGWNGGALGEPIPGALIAVEKLIARGNRVIVFSTRDRYAIIPWLRNYGFPELEVTDRKPPFRVLLDDRAVTFDGTWTDEWIDRLHTFSAHWENGEHIL